MPPYWNEIRPYNDISPDETSLSYQKILELTRAYAAATSYIDAQIGRILDQLDELGLTEKTVVAFCGDHGYHLSENGTWGKNIFYETTLRSPLVVSVPGQCQQGAKTNALVELVDIFPTLCETCQIPILPQLEGLSMAPVIEQPTVPWKTAAFSQRKRVHSMRTDRYRYTELGSHKELYDYGTDPNSEHNIANLPENSELVAHLSERLHAGWQKALPDITPSRVACLQTLPWDINNDGIVDIQDLILVSNNFGKVNPVNPKVDVNQDGNIDIIDLLLVASHYGESSNTTAPPKSTALLLKDVDHIKEWLTEARIVNDNSNVFQRGIAALEELMNSVIPEKTVLLPNYPNPFNPETWIPYDLAKETDVRITIYNLKGESVMQLNIGFQAAGTYR
ncbi:MAG: sulfatase-like hydrolase/transferase, partial [Candidatus Poribacteria bacterium]|nr:sulfatase-like hydrolase/transferase [Candidatus Poribacteria bacterium]